MLLALVLMAQVTTTPQNPCSDQLSELCRISPLFCPSAYPDGFVPGTNGVPCWPGRQLAPVGPAGRLERSPITVGRAPAQVSAGAAAQSAAATRSGAATVSARERLLERIRRLLVGLEPGRKGGSETDPRD